MEHNTPRNANQLQFKKLPKEYTQEFQKKAEMMGEEWVDPHLFIEMNYPTDPWFPHPHYIIGVHRNDNLPSYFYVYCKQTTMVFDLVTYGLVGIKRHGRNPKIVKHTLDHIHQWLNSVEPVFAPKTYGEHMRASWRNEKYVMLSDGKILTLKEWEEYVANLSISDMDDDLPLEDTEGFIEPK